MSDFFLICLIALGVIVYSFIEALTKIGASGGSPTKLLADILGKTKTDNDNIYLDEATRLKVGSSIIRWRNIAGCLTGLLSFFIFFSFMILPPGPDGNPSGISWTAYLFFPILIVTIIAFIILRKKEKEFLRKQNKL